MHRGRRRTVESWCCRTPSSLGSRFASSAAAPKIYILKYRAGTGQDAPLRKLSIGKHGSPWTPDEARAEAKWLSGLMARGKDPAGAKTAAKAAPTVADLAQRFLTEACRGARPRRRGNIAGCSITSCYRLSAKSG
jgi:hypothetical protein